jgi:3-hydroxyacyl-[acyl-carrier-protein] dehydratase
MQLEYFRMIDKVTLLEASRKTIVCEAKVPNVSPIFEGHFPGYPLMPGVLLIETMAQASGYLILKQIDFVQMPFFIAADGVKLRQFVMPGDMLSIEAKLLHEGSGFAVTKAKITRKQEASEIKICEAELKFKLMPFINDNLKTALASQARLIELSA